MQIVINKKSMFFMLLGITAGMSASFPRTQQDCSTPRAQSTNNGVAGSSPNNDSMVESTPGHGHETDAEGVSPLRRTRNESTTIEFFEAPRTPRNDEELAAQTEIAAKGESFYLTPEGRFQVVNNVLSTLTKHHDKPTRRNVELPAPKNTPAKPRQTIPGAEEFHNSIRSMRFEIDSQNLSFQQQEKSLNADRKKTLLALENKITNLHALETSRYEAIQTEQAKKFHCLKSMAGNDLWKLRTASRKKRLERPTLNDLMIDHNLFMDKVRAAHTKVNQQYFQ